MARRQHPLHLSGGRGSCASQHSLRYLTSPFTRCLSYPPPCPLFQGGFIFSFPRSLLLSASHSSPPPFLDNEPFST